MSSAGCVLVLLLFVSPLYEALETKDESSVPKRRQRSLTDLYDMVRSITGRNSADFVGYGNYCGFGGSGDAIDPIDECCQTHDFCYDVINTGPCADSSRTGVYLVNYKWRVAHDRTAVCEADEDGCKLAICICDALFSNCLKQNINSYNEMNRKDKTLREMFGEFITSL